MLVLSDEYRTVTSSTVSGPCKKKARCPKVFVFVKGMRKVLVSDMERSCVVDGRQSGVQKDRLGNFL